MSIMWPPDCERLLKGVIIETLSSSVLSALSGFEGVKTGMCGTWNVKRETQNVERKT